MVSSCSPIVCCTNSKDAKTRDECMCGFGYLNGGLQVSAAQCFLILGSFFSIASLGDCAFVKIDEDLRFVLGPTKTSNTFGYVTFEDAFDGRCYWYDDAGATSQTQLQEYWDFLGHDFSLTRIFAMIGAAGGWLQFAYSTTFCCSSQTRRIRYLQFFLVSVVLTCFQGLTLLIFNSDFCEEYACTFGRSAGFSGASCACYFMAGAMYCAMSDYPGDEFAVRSNGTEGAHSDSQQDEFNDEESAAGSQEGDDATDTSLSDGGDDQDGDATEATAPTKNTNISNKDDVEAPFPSVSDSDSSVPGDDFTTPSVTSIYIEDGASSATPAPCNDGSTLGPPTGTDSDEDPLAPAFNDSSATEAATATSSTTVEEEEDLVQDDGGGGGEPQDDVAVAVVEEEEYIEEEYVEEEVVDDETEVEYEEQVLNGGLPTVMEVDEPLSPVPQKSSQRQKLKQSLGAPQAPPESPIGREARIPQSAMEFADDSSDDPIFE